MQNYIVKYCFGSLFYRCSKIVPCPDAPHQTCGCKEPSGTQAPAETIQSVVYNIDTTDKGKTSLFGLLLKVI